jgi:hypothetical protein
MDIPKPAKNCSVSQRELQPNEPFYSVLTEEINGLQRSDISVEEWKTPPNDLPEDWVGWWQTKMPENPEKKSQLAPNDVLLELFEELGNDTQETDIRYILTLLLIRRRMFRLEREEVREGQKMLIVYDLKRNLNYEIPVALPAPKRVEEIQTQLSELLYK